MANCWVFVCSFSLSKFSPKFWARISGLVPFQPKVILFSQKFYKNFLDWPNISVLKQRKLEPFEKRNRWCCAHRTFLFFQRNDAAPVMAFHVVATDILGCSSVQMYYIYCDNHKHCVKMVRRMLISICNSKSKCVITWFCNVTSFHTTHDVRFDIKSFDKSV